MGLAPGCQELPVTSSKRGDGGLGTRGARHRGREAGSRELCECHASVGCTWPGSCKGGSRWAKAQGRHWLQPRGHLFRQAEHHVTDTAPFRRERFVFEEKGLIACNTERKAAPAQSLSVLIKGQQQREFRKNSRKPEFSIGARASVAPRCTHSFRILESCANMNSLVSMNTQRGLCQVPWFWSGPGTK